MQTLYSRQTFLFKDGKSQASLSHKSQNCISVNVTTPEQFDASFKLTRIKPRTKPVAKQNNLKILQLTNLKIYNSKIKCEILVFHSRLPTFSTFLSRIDLLHEFAEAFELGLVLLHLFLLLLVLWQLQTLFGDRDQVLAVELLQLLDTILVNGLGHVQDLEATLTDTLHEGGVGHLVLALT